MTDPEAMAVLYAAVESWLRQRMEVDSRLREAVHHLASRVAALTNASDDHATVPLTEPTQTAPDSSTPLLTTLPPLVLGGAMPNEGFADVVASFRRQQGADASSVRAPAATESLPDLGLIARRARLKAEVCRWVIEKRKRLDTGADFVADLKATEDDLIARLKALPSCFIGLLHRDAYLPVDSVLERLACNYENLAAAALLARDVMDPSAGEPRLREALAVFAGAQSSLRIAVSDAYLNRDTDQDESFRWLSVQAAHTQVLIDRHMRLDDPADPRDWQLWHERIAAAHEDLRAVLDSARLRKKLFGKLRHHVRALADGGSASPEHDWRKVLECLDALVTSGLPCSDPDVRELILWIDAPPPDGIEIPSNAARVLEAVDRYAEAAAADAIDAEPNRREPSEEVRRAAALLRNRRMVLIGGDARPLHRERLERELELGELCWIGSREHQSTAPFAPEIARHDTALVAVIIGLSSHSFAWDAADMCRKHGKIFVRLPKRGYNVNQVAHQVLIQASEQLAALSPIVSPAHAS